MALHALWQSDLSPSSNREEMMNKLTFDHIHLFTRDPEATATFYERMFGAEVIRSTQEGKPRIDLKLGGANIFILDVSGTQRPAPAQHIHTKALITSAS